MFSCQPHCTNEILYYTMLGHNMLVKHSLYLWGSMLPLCQSHVPVGHIITPPSACIYIYAHVQCASGAYYYPTIGLYIYVYAHVQHLQIKIIHLFLCLSYLLCTFFSCLNSKYSCYFWQTMDILKIPRYCYM